MNNREAGLIIQGDVSNYFKQLFLNDWNVEVTEVEDSFDYKFILLFLIIIVAFILAWFKKGRKI